MIWLHRFQLAPPFVTTSQNGNLRMLTLLKQSTAVPNHGISLIGQGLLKEPGSSVIAMSDKFQNLDNSACLNLPGVIYRQVIDRIWVRTHRRNYYVHFHRYVMLSAQEYDLSRAKME